MRVALWRLLGLLLLVGLMLLAISVGATRIPLAEVIDASAARLGFGDPDARTSPQARIILYLRLPRAILAVIVGAGLGVIGCLLQTITRNDLADPFLFGLSSGAATGAVFVITVTGDVLGFWTLPLAAFAGGLVASIVVLALVSQLRDQGPAQLVLAGLAISSLFMAVTNYLVFAGDQRAAHSGLFWSLGGLGRARWDLLPVVLGGLGVLIAFAVWRRARFDALLAGDDTATTLGVDVPAMRRTTFLVCAFATASFVSVTGVIGFIGLMVPHMARTLVGPMHGPLFATSAIIGAGILLVSDIVARTLLSPQELPIGVVTTFAGALFVLVLVRKL